MGPIAHTYGHDLPRLIDEAVPCLAAMVDDVVVGLEDAVREPVVAHELPDILDGVQLWAFRWERHQRDGRRHDEVARQVPAGLIEEKNRMLAGRDLGRNLGQVQGHRLGVASWKDERRALSIVWADGSEDIGGGGALVVRSRGPCPASGPAPRDFVLLADPGLVGEPDLYVVAIEPLLARDLRQAGWERFLKASIAPLAWA